MSIGWADGWICLGAIKQTACSMRMTRATQASMQTPHRHLWCALIQSHMLLTVLPSHEYAQQWRCNPRNPRGVVPGLCRVR